MKPKPNSASTSKEDDKPPQKPKSLLETGSFFIAETDLLPFYPHYFQTSLTRKQQSYYLGNGHASLIKSLKVQIISQIDICEDLWKEFSRNQTLFDTWIFRYAFYKAYKHKPFFILIKNELDNLALLPLWYEEDKKLYTWFGSTWQEENKFFIKDPLFIPLLLAICPSPVELNAISTQLPAWSKEVIRFKADDPKFILDLTGTLSVDDYLSSFKKKRRYNLKRDRKRIEAQNPKIIINEYKHYENLVDLSIKRFTEKGEDTDWEDPRRVDTFKNVIEIGSNKGQFKIRTISVVVRNKIAAVDLVAIYKNCYYPLKCGYDVGNFPGIGNYMNLYEIEDAINLGMKKMDFLEIGYGWKEKWFEAIPLLKYEKKRAKKPLQTSFVTD